MSESDLESIRHYRRLGPRLATAGQPEPAQLAFLPPAFDCVINLARPDSPHALADEAKLVRQQGLDYVHIPVDFKHPRPRDLTAFFDTMQAYAGRRVFVHCALNWRVSAFVFLHRVINEHCDPDLAYKDLHAIWQPDPVWQSFIDASLAQYPNQRK